MSVTSLALEAVAPWCVALFLSFVGVSGLWLRRQTLGAGAAISGDSGHFEASHSRETPYKFCLQHETTRPRTPKLGGSGWALAMCLELEITHL